MIVITDEAKDYLSKACPIFAEVIKKSTPYNREVNPNIFEVLISNIIGQQISAVAAVTVYNRLVELAGKVTPEVLANLTVEEIQKCGMSFRKATYIYGTATAFARGEINAEELKSMSDNEVIQALVKLPGIGKWTAQMVLMFSLGRPDVMSYDDLIIKRNLMAVYGLESLTRKEFEQYATKFSPFGTVASLYFWNFSG